MWDISGGDVDFILTMKMENGLLTADREHEKYYWCANSQTMETDWGFGISKCYHRDIVEDPRFNDYKWQLSEAYRLYSEGTKFYGHDVRNKARQFFTFK